MPTLWNTIISLRSRVARLFRLRRPRVHVCEPDIEAAISHLRGTPHGERMPESWHRQHLLERLTEAIGARPMVGEFYDVAHGVYALIKPYRADLLRLDAGKAEFSQAWILFRPRGNPPCTDHSMMMQKVKERRTK